MVNKTGKAGIRNIAEVPWQQFPDHFLVSNNLISIIKNIEINKKPRSKIKPSDHTPIELKIN